MMHPILKKLSVIVAVGCLIFSNYIHAEKIKIKGLDIKYNELSKIMIASGNAQLIHPDFSINADIIRYNQASGDIIGQHNVELQQSNQLILSEKFAYNTKTNIIKINDLLLELTTQQQKPNHILNCNQLYRPWQQKNGTQWHFNNLQL